MESAAKRGEDYLERATEHTLSLLARNRKGFFAMIEGSQIDGAGHGNNTKKLLGEMRDFDRAVNKAFDFADKNPGTLVIVTADHETGGLTVVSNDRDFTAAESGIEYKYSTTSHSGTPVILYAYGARGIQFQRRNRKYGGLPADQGPADRPTEIEQYSHRDFCTP